MLADVHKHNHHNCFLNDGWKCFSVYFALRFEGRLSSIMAHHNRTWANMEVQISLSSICKATKIMFHHVTSMFVSSNVYQSSKPFPHYHLTLVQERRFWMILCPVDWPLEQFSFINVQFVSSMSKLEEPEDHGMGVEAHAGLGSADFSTKAQGVRDSEARDRR